LHWDTSCACPRAVVTCCGDGWDYGPPPFLSQLPSILRQAGPRRHAALGALHHGAGRARCGRCMEPRQGLGAGARGPRAGKRARGRCGGAGAQPCPLRRSGTRARTYGTLRRRARAIKAPRRLRLSAPSDPRRKALTLRSSSSRPPPRPAPSRLPRQQPSICPQDGPHQCRPLGHPEPGPAGHAADGWLCALGERAWPGWGRGRGAWGAGPCSQQRTHACTSGGQASAHAASVNPAQGRCFKAALRRRGARAHGRRNCEPLPCAPRPALSPRRTTVLGTPPPADDPTLARAPPPCPPILNPPAGARRRRVRG
jgi:hypothetical protein